MSGDRPPGPELAYRTCARRLAPFGLAPAEGAISWLGPARFPVERQGSEAVVQALSGLMAVNGRDAGRPRLIGLEVASVAAGVLAAQGVLATRIAQRRGARSLGGEAVPYLETSVLQAALLLLSHYLAAATAGGEQVPTAPGPAPGPPFRTAEGRWFEIEVFDPEAWKAFWSALGAGDADLGRAWTSFRGRYYRGDCSFPPGLHEAAMRHPLAAIASSAERHRVSLCVLRDYEEVVADAALPGGHPRISCDPPAGAAGAAAGVAAGVGTGRAGTAGGLREPHDLPLIGLRVVEATNRMQGPLAGLLLAMLGADVVKVEPPGGDVGRMVPPVAGDTGSFFLCFNRRKSAVELDLSQPHGRSELGDLLDGADVFLHNWRPGKAAAWGLDAADLAPPHPRLVYATASGWGEPSLDARLIGTDFLVQAHSGAGYGLSPRGRPPRTTRVLLTDFMGALVTCEGILGGLYRREETGGGVLVGTSLFQGAMALQAHVFDGLTEGREEGRRNGRPVWSPLDLPLQTADAVLVVTADDDSRFDRVREVCGADSGGGRETVERAMVERLRSGSAEAWEKLLVDAGVPCALACTDLAALPADPSLGGLLEPLPGEAGTAWAPRSPWLARR